MIDQFTTRLRPNLSWRREWMPLRGQVGERSSRGEAYAYLARGLPSHFQVEEAVPRPSEQELAAAEKLAPGLLSHFDDRNPGMHRSATTDMLYVISGRCVLELDDGSKTEIGTGDVVVQSGTMHRWHNPFNEPCRMLGAIVGARWTK